MQITHPLPLSFRKRIADAKMNSIQERGDICRHSENLISFYSLSLKKQNIR